MAITDTFGDPIVIRYDGLDAEQHLIELSALGESIKGLGRILSVSANFAATEKYLQHKDALSVRVMAKPPEAHCFELTAVFQWVSQNALAATIVGGLTVTLVSYVFAKLAGNKAEMKELRGALETAIKQIGNRDQKVVERLLETVDKMAEALRPAARQAVAPIGRTAGSLSITSTAPNSIAARVGVAERDAIEATEPLDIGVESVFHVTIHEMNMDNGTCRVALADEPDSRISAVITDPIAMQPNNVYAVAFAARTEIAVKGKGAIKDGLIEKLYISNTASLPST